MKRLIAGLALLALVACGGGDNSANLPGLVAVKRAPVTGPGGCGVRDAWVVTEVAGVRLSRPSIMTMRTARALDRWVRRGAVPAIGRRGGGLVELTVAAHYACRTRNSRAGARLSEHAQGRAIDISSFVLASGERISVLRGWRGEDSRVLRRMHGAACGPFGTVLGPNADRHHQDHFHFDVADHRGGPYCR
ncbi:extensin-like domain-containing protein [Boseongicola aestuarii]|uniref:Extensin-like C-terminal domain-containing protein n=1 Tax=Boseongicola aestuarii TaxID=1470561 RepID=A0A238IY90_9RHOB|nr:extensin family protein [Boseongicola aestuarii]SMX22952.1 hypothetical protein BOA8489_01051 [Boseongicola aestuarii]